MVRVGADTREAEGGLSKVNSLVGGLGSVALKAAGWIGALFAIRGASQMAHSLVDYSAQLEQSAIAWGTLLKSQEAGVQMMRRLQEFARVTPFDYASIEEGARRLKAMGFEAQELLPWMERIGNAAAALGLGTEGMNRLILALGQMRAKTKVTGEEMRQLTEAGVPAWDILAQAIGKTTAETMKLASQGKISAQTFLQAFAAYTEKNYGGMMERQARTFSGAMSNIRDSLLQLGSTAFAPLFEGISTSAQKFAEFLGSPQVRGFATTIANALRSAGGAFAEFRQRFSSESSAIGKAAQNLWYGIVGYASEQLPKLQGTFTGVVNIVTAIWNKFGDDIVGILSTALEWIGDIVGYWLDLLGDTFRLGMALVNGDWSGAWEAFRTTVYHALTTVVDYAINAGVLIVRATRAIATALGKDTTDIDQSIAEMEGWKQSFRETAAEWLNLDQELAKPRTQSFQEWVQKGKKAWEDFSSSLQKPTQGMADFRMVEQETAQTTANLGNTLQGAAGAAQDFGNALLNALLTSHPALIAVGQEIAALQVQIAGVNAALQSNSVAQHNVQRRISEIQEKVSSLRDELSTLQQRLQELSAPRLTGMGEMERQINALQDHLRRMDLARALRIPLDEAIRRFPLLTEGAEEFIQTLPTGRRALERYLQALQLQYEAQYEERQRLLKQAVEGQQPEITFEAAMKEIATTKARMEEVTASLTTQEEALKRQEQALARLSEEAWGLGQALQGLQQQLQAAQERQTILNDALQLAYNWFLNDRQAMLDMGGTAAQQVPIIDEKARALLTAVSTFASGTSTESIATIQEMANQFKISSALAVAEVLENLGKIPKDIYTYHHIVTVYEGGAAGPAPTETFTPRPRQSGGAVYAGQPYIVGERGPELFVPNVSGAILPSVPGGKVEVNVYVSGSVVAERDIAEAVRAQILRVQRRNGSAW